MTKNFLIFQKLIKKGYSLDGIYMLQEIKKGIDVKLLCEGEKLLGIYSSLKRKGLLSENDKITLLGDEILEFINRDDETIIVPKISLKTEDFNLWWKCYPGTDSFAYKGMSFTGSRGLRVKKEECKEKFNAILQEGEYTALQLIQCLEYEIKMKKENSFKTKQNKMSYMQNSCTYLHQRTFENFIDLIGQETKEEEVFDGVNI